MKHLVQHVFCQYLLIRNDIQVLDVIFVKIAKFFFDPSIFLPSPKIYFLPLVSPLVKIFLSYQYFLAKSITCLYMVKEICKLKFYLFNLTSPVFLA